MVWHATEGSLSRRIAASTLTVVALGALTVTSALPASADGGGTGGTAASAGNRKPSATGNPFTGPVGGTALGKANAVVYDKAPGVQAPPNVPVKSYVVADLDSGEILAAKNAHQRNLPASCLKTLTAVTLLPRLDKRARYTAVHADANVEGSKVGLVPGQAYTVDQLFYGLFLPSGNDAANALANASGGVRNTVALMNAEASRLGAFDTHAVTPSGLDPDVDPTSQHSSAYDLALIARAGLERSDFRRYVSTRTYAFPGRAAPKGKSAKTYQIQNLNRLLTHYSGAFGVKNGYTSKAHNTWIGAAERGGHRLVAVVMHTSSPGWEKDAELLDWGFSAVGKARPIGTLVTPQDVAHARQQLAAERKPASDRTGKATKSAAPSDPSAGGATAAVADTRSAATMFTPTALWIWGAALVFVVLASMRVSAHVRARRRRP